MFKPYDHEDISEDTKCLSVNVHIVELNGVRDVEFNAGNVERILAPLGGEGVDVAYTVNGVTKVQFLRSNESSNGFSDFLYLPANVSAVIRGDASLSVTEAPAVNVKHVKFVNGATVSSTSNIFAHIETDVLHAFESALKF